MRRLSLKHEVRAFVVAVQRDGWQARRASGGHLRLVHPDATAQVFAGTTPSDRRWTRNTRAQMRRALENRA